MNLERLRVPCDKNRRRRQAGKCCNQATARASKQHSHSSCSCCLNERWQHTEPGQKDRRLLDPCWTTRNVSLPRPECQETYAAARNFYGRRACCLPPMSLLPTDSDTPTHDRALDRNKKRDCCHTGPRRQSTPSLVPARAMMDTNHRRPSAR